MYKTDLGVVKEGERRPISSRYENAHGQGKR